MIMKVYMFDIKRDTIQTTAFNAKSLSYVKYFILEKARTKGSCIKIILEKTMNHVPSTYFI